MRRTLPCLVFRKLPRDFIELGAVIQLLHGLLLLRVFLTQNMSDIYRLCPFLLASLAPTAGRWLFRLAGAGLRATFWCHMVYLILKKVWNDKSQVMPGNARTRHSEAWWSELLPVSDSHCT